MLKKLVIALYFAIFINLIICDRRIEVEINPNCKECEVPDNNGSYNNLVHVRSIGENDTIHMLFSNINSFTTMLFRTSLNSELKVDSKKLLSKNATEIFESIQFTEKPYDSFGYTFPNIYEINDTNGDADLSKVFFNQTITHFTSDLIWKKYQIQTNTSGIFEGSLGSNHNGSFKFLIRYLGRDLRDIELPRLLLNPESISIDFIIDSVEASFKLSKFGLNVLFLSNNTNTIMNSKRTLDDEYTPATFKLWQVEIQDSQNLTCNYFQWRPIFYYFMPKNVENSTITKQYDIKNVDFNTSLNSLNQLGIGSAFFGISKTFSSMNISFGIEGDEKNGYFYPQTNYSIWTFSLGLGQAPIEKMSSVVSLVIFVGFGLPVLVIVIGLIVMIVKKIRQSRNYSEFQQL